VAPEQISKRLLEDHPDDPEMRVSHETVYERLYLQSRGVLRTELTIALRQGRVRRVSRSRTTATRGKIRDMVHISERPKEADDRAVPGFLGGATSLSAKATSRRSPPLSSARADSFCS
jgi:IS30 family transposase